MKTLIDYYNEVTTGTKIFSGFPVSMVSLTIARIMAIGKKEVYLTPDEYESFLQCYDQILPYNWDGKTFRGLKIKKWRHLIKKE